MIEELKKLIYPIPENGLDKKNIEKYLFKLLRESIIAKKYEVKIGPYILNFNPPELKVHYETELTKVELSNVDTYYETSRPLETKYYCISNEDKDTYLPTLPYYFVSGNILNIDGTTEEHYEIELITDNPNIVMNDYLNIPSNFKIISNKETSIVIYHEIKKNDKRTNPLSFFSTSVKAVYYDEEKDLFIKKDMYINETYAKYLPELTKEKEIVAFIFNTMKNFYNKYYK